MSPDESMVLVFGGLHVVALALACLLFWMFLRSETVKPWESEDPDEGGGGGGGGNDRNKRPPAPKPGPSGLPLEDSVPAATRFRGPGRLADAHPFPRTRRPDHAPAPEPVRTPERV